MSASTMRDAAKAASELKEAHDAMFKAIVIVRFGIDGNKRADGAPMPPLMACASAARFVPENTLRHERDVEARLWCQIAREFPRVWDMARRKFYELLGEHLGKAEPTVQEREVTLGEPPPIGLRRKIWAARTRHGNAVFVAPTFRDLDEAFLSGRSGEAIPMNACNFEAIFGFLPPHYAIPMPVRFEVEVAVPRDAVVSAEEVKP